MSALETATAFAPASIGNVAVGFDILGMAVDVLGDRVRVRRLESPTVRIAAVVGADLPRAPAQNTAGRALIAMQEALKTPFGFEVEIEKGIPLGSGLGGSAASAVAAVVAANALLDAPCRDIELLRFAIEGEAVASGARHVDNVAPSLFGGLVLTVGVEAPIVTRIPTPPGLRAIVVHPHFFLATKQARGVLKRTVELSDFVWQSANLAGFLAACYTSDARLLRASFQDVVIEPQRAALIPGFDRARDAAMAQGAVGCSISGAGPTTFAWAEASMAEAIRVAMVDAFAASGLKADSWVISLECPGARLVAAP